MAKAKQQSIPDFSSDEQRLVDEAMQIERIRTQGMWTKRAALMWATLVIAENQGMTAAVDKLILARRKRT